MEALEAFKFQLVMMFDDVDLGFTEDQGSQPAKEYRRAIEQLNTECSSWIAAVTSCQASW